MVGNPLGKSSSARRVSRARRRRLRPRPSHRRDRREPLPTDVDHHQQEEPPRPDEVEAAGDTDGGAVQAARLPRHHPLRQLRPAAVGGAPATHLRHSGAALPLDE
jgi:hypothetical protein